jgi:hypothetical protein
MFAARGGFFYQQDTGPVSNIIFPASSIVPYYSSANLPAGDWIVYTAANNKYIAGTTNPALLGSTTGDVMARVTGNTGVTGSGGSHNGYASYISGASNTNGGSLSDSTNRSDGVHAHAGGNIAFGNLVPDRANVTLLIANRNTPTIPAGTMAFRNPSTGSYGDQMYVATSYIYPNTNYSPGYITAGPGTATWYGSTSTNGSHRHNNLTKLYKSTGTMNNYWGTNGEGAHSHSITASMYQTLMDNTLVMKAWTSLVARAPATDVVVMYVGSLSALTGTGWYLCDGTNGTLNMNNYYAAAGSGWGNTYNNDAYLSSYTIDSYDAGHSHISNYNGGSPGITIYHDYQSWSHTHSWGSSPSITPFQGGKFYLYFIQYKG